MRCLIIDDDESARELMTRIVKRAGHRATAVRNGPDGVFAVGSQPFDVAIVDLGLPGMDGAAAISALRGVEPDIRVLVVSGYDDRKHVLEAFAAGADGYIVKDELADTLTDSLQQVRAGNSPLSPRVASVVVRAVRPVARRETDKHFTVGADGNPPVDEPAATRRRPRKPLASGTDSGIDDLSRPGGTVRTRAVKLRMATGTSQMEAAQAPERPEQPRPPASKDEPKPDNH